VEKLTAPFDAILLDLNLPDSFGVDTVKKMRASAPTTPIIVLTAMEDRVVIKEAVDNGADSYLIKDKTDGNRMAVGILWAMRARESEDTKNLKEAEHAAEQSFSVEKYVKNEGKVLLNRVTSGMQLQDALERLIKTVESSAESGTAISILLSDGTGRLKTGAGPSLPDMWNHQVNGIVIGPAAGSCGTAAHCKHPVYVADIESDPLWADYRSAALSHGLRACSSFPIISDDEQVLGTIAVYYNERKAPSDAEKQLLCTVSGIAKTLIMAASEVKRTSA
jgi:CheY-like chemotaxis protein